MTPTEFYNASVADFLAAKARIDSGEVTFTHERVYLERYDFADEGKAKTYLEDFLCPFFVLKPEVWCRYVPAGNRLRIDYLARPREGVDFPFRWFGLEVKRSCNDSGSYNAALKQAIDYTFCAVDDARLPRLNGQRIEHVYVYPALPDTEAFWVNRLAGKFHVGMVYERITGGPAFFACGGRQWCSRMGVRKLVHNTVQRVGSGVRRAG